MPEVVDEAEDLQATFERLARGGASKFAGALVPIGSPVESSDHRTVCRVHLIQTDANGNVRARELAKRIFDRVVPFCIPRSRIRQAKEISAEDDDWGPLGALQREAKNLFVNQMKTGEPGELLLFLLQEYVLKIPQIVAKMPLKTSTSMHIHGSDGLHAKLLPDGLLALYWGESKLHKTLNGALKDAFESLEEYLNDSNEDKTNRDLEIIRDNLDVDDEELTKRLYLYFAGETEESAKVEYRAACLVGFDVVDYPEIKAGETEVSEDLQKIIDSWTKTLNNRITSANFQKFSIELFMIPFESVFDFRVEFLKHCGVDTEKAIEILKERDEKKRLAKEAKAKQQPDMDGEAEGSEWDARPSDD
ncbi:HamA C-terminal domain-containing protein [Arthrobacter koreensis]|uniref:HamA C-terminal domain-containing protein n=1 Tax=Arthrobacter koreensis TaxID=199136 RepID=UPI0037FD4DB1